MADVASILPTPSLVQLFRAHLPRLHDAYVCTQCWQLRSTLSCAGVLPASQFQHLYVCWVSHFPELHFLLGRRFDYKTGFFIAGCSSKWTRGWFREKNSHHVLKLYLSITFDIFNTSHNNLSPYIPKRRRLYMIFCTQAPLLHPPICAFAMFLLLPCFHYWSRVPSSVKSKVQKNIEDHVMNRILLSFNFPFCHTFQRHYRVRRYITPPSHWSSTLWQGNAISLQISKVNQSLCKIFLNIKLLAQSISLWLSILLHKQD